MSPDGDSATLTRVGYGLFAIAAGMLAYSNLAIAVHEPFGIDTLVHVGSALMAASMALYCGRVAIKRKAAPEIYSEDDV